MKWLMFAVLAAIMLIPAPVSLIPGARDEDEITRNRCDVCTRWSECNGVDEECPWKENEHVSVAELGWMM